MKHSLKGITALKEWLKPNLVGHSPALDLSLEEVEG